MINCIFFLYVNDIDVFGYLQEIKEMELGQEQKCYSEMSLNYILAKKFLDSVNKYFIKMF